MALTRSLVNPRCFLFITRVFFPFQVTINE